MTRNGTLCRWHSRRQHCSPTLCVLYNSTFRLFLVVFLILAMMKRAAVATQAPCFPAYVHQENVTALAASQNNFTRDIYMKLAQKSSGNLFFSPFSIMTALGMTYAGADGNTEKEMQSVMHLSQDNEAIHNAFQDIVTDLKTEVAHYELRTSNMAYVSDKMSVLSNFSNILKEKYLSSSKNVNFAKGEEVRQEINTVVKKETNSRIEDLIPAGILNALTRMVLVNAVYFKGLWEHQFKESETKDQEFWLSGSESTKVPMMHIKDHFRMLHNKDLGATLLAMDYKGSRLSMVFVLPEKRDGLVEVEAKLAAADLNEIDKKLMKEEVHVYIPKFKLEESLDLVDHLSEMGMKDLFDENSCDLSGITGTKELYVSNVIHKAFLEVNEQGSEAAAATASVLQTLCYRPDIIILVDHPFCFFIRDNHSGLILFTGRFVQP
ncbi:leukocyte elastase inhibitor-like isoform X2 [Homarus americanus]|uniref:leukocyte elastase inhibitor-like isoform X2 n=1 Tax=Homarus americanus TaxID=6706 RepID=UPI001C450FD9|nr:leukocyte elastase inhibitor-like isoform X2 [Homarus americanus]